MAAPLPPSRPEPESVTEPVISPPSPEGEPELQNRRESDRTGVERGLRSGGRRASDRSPITKRSPYLTFAILASFLFSGGVLLWAFTLPFRHSDHPATIPSDTLAIDDRDPEAQLSNEDFVAKMMAKEVQLRKHIEMHNQKDRDLPDLQETQRHWQRSKKRMEDRMQALLVEADGPPEKGSLEWQTIEEMRNVLEDAPPDRYRNRQPER